MSSKNEIVIIGAGVTGLTTAILFAALGYETTVISEDNPLDNTRRQGKMLPSTSSFFPAASVIPHSMNYNSEIIERIFSPTQVFWKLLAATSAFGVRQAMNIDVFCDLPQPKPIPEYLRFMEPHSEQVPESALTKAIQETFPQSNLSGYGHAYFLAQMDWYAPLLSRLYALLGGKIIKKSFSIDDIDVESRPIILAAGMGSERLAKKTGGKTLAGHLIMLDVDAELQGRVAQYILSGQYESYGLLPPPGTYNLKAMGENIDGDLYIYLRASGSWVLGGSRIPCNFEPTMEWEPEFDGVPTLSLPRRGAPGQQLRVPAPIWEINAEILSRLFGVDINRHITNREAALGLRYLTALPEVGAEVQRKPDAPCLAYYGYGGSGVTCSWGVAIDAVKEMKRRMNHQVPMYRLAEIAKGSAEFQSTVSLLQHTALGLL